MTPQDIHVNNVLATHASTSSDLIGQSIINILSPTINQWGNGHIYGIHLSGSIAKGTAIQGLSDVDILVSVNYTAQETLQEVYESLFNWLDSKGYSPRRQNVSIGLNIEGFKVDVVPAKRQSAWANDHSLWSHKHQSRRDTNIHQHIKYVVESNRIDEIKLAKVWKKLHGLEFPSFPLEITVIEALKWSKYGATSENFVKVLEYIRDNIQTVRIIDPTKPSNILSDDLTNAEKDLLSSIAAKSLLSRWDQVLW